MTATMITVPCHSASSVPCRSALGHSNKGVRGFCDQRASSADNSFDDLCDEWEGKALRRSSRAAQETAPHSKKHVRLTLRDTLCGPKLR